MRWARLLCSGAAVQRGAGQTGWLARAYIGTTLYFVNRRGRCAQGSALRAPTRADVHDHARPHRASAETSHAALPAASATRTLSSMKTSGYSASAAASAAATL